MSTDPSQSPARRTVSFNAYVDIHSPQPSITSQSSSQDTIVHPSQSGHRRCCGLLSCAAAIGAFIRAYVVQSWLWLAGGCLFVLVGLTAMRNRESAPTSQN